MLASGRRYMEPSATQNKVRHHMSGGGHLLNLWGPSLESHIAGCWHDRSILSALVIQIQYTIYFNNPIIVMSITLAIWSFSHSDNGTRMLCPDGCGWNTAPVWTTTGMRHWKRLIKISGDIDCYYCIIILLHILSIMIILFIVILLYMHVLLFMSCHYPAL